MKHCLLLFFCCTYYFSIGQVLQSADFNDGMLPAGWILTNTSGANWQFDDNGGNNLNGDGMAYYDDDAIGSAFVGSATMTTSAVDATGGGTILLEYDYNYRHLGSSSFTVEVFDGSAWNVVQSLSASDCGSWGCTYPSASIDVTAFANASMQVRFIYDDGGGWNWYVGVDNYSLTRQLCTAATAGNETLVPNCPTGNTVTFDVTDLGSAGSLTVTNDQGGTNPDPIMAMGTYSVTDLPADGSVVTITLTPNDDVLCEIELTGVTLAECPPANDDCSGVIDLGGEISPLSGNTCAANNDFIVSCLSNASARDVVYSIEVPAGDELTIEQTSNSYDSKHRLAYGGSCPGDTEITCTDDPDTEQTVWFNSTGSSQTVYWVQSAFSTGCGDYTLAWSVETPACAPPEFTAEADNSACPEDISIVVDVTALGTANAVTITASQGMDMEDGVGVGEYFLTGYAPGDGDVTVYVADSENPVCIDSVIVSIVDACPPPNDECDLATTLIESADNTCSNSVSGTTVDATKSSETTLCSTFSNDDDVWYTFSPSMTANYTFEVSNTTTNTYVHIYSGTCEAGLTSEGGCFESNSNTADLMMGETYLVQVHTSSSSIRTDFDLCAYPTPPPPSNDECIDAIALTLSSDSDCNNAESGTTEQATQSSETSLCSTFSNDDDVWYSFTPAEDGAYIFELSNTSSNTYVHIYSGTCEGGLTSESTCFATGSTQADLMAMETYLVQVHTSSSSLTTDFDICVYAAPSAPENDLCAGAIDLPVGSSCMNTLGTNVSATASGETPAAPCGSFGTGEDVWYKLTVPTSGNVVISSSAAGGPTDWAMTAYSGACGALVEIECNDDGGPTTFPEIALEGQTAGSTIYIRFYEFGNNAFGEFNICAYEQSEVVSSGEQESCVSADNVTIDAASGNNNEFVNFYTGGDNSGELVSLVASINANGNDLGTTSVSYYSTATDRADGGGIPYLNRNVEVTPTSQPSSNVTVRLYFTQAEIDALIAADPAVSSIADIDFTKTQQTCSAAYVPGGQVFIAQTGNGTTADGNVYIDFDTDSFSTFFGNGQNTALPAELISFAGEAMDDGNMITWITATEINTEMFILERSENGVTQWESIGEVKAAGNSSDQRSYEFMDRYPSAKSYYRLVTMDKDGASEYSQVISLRTALADQELIAYPNPTTGLFNLEMTALEDQEAQVFIRDINGKLVVNRGINLSQGFNNITLSEDLPSGVYQILIQKDAKMTNTTIVITD